MKTKVLRIFQVCFAGILMIGCPAKPEKILPSIDDKMEKLHLVGVNPKTAQGHIRMVENSPAEQIHPDFIPVHIFLRTNENQVWALTGNGTLDPKTRVIITTNHLFEGKTAQYGYRKVSPEVLKNGGEILPISSRFDVATNADDPLYCIAAEKAGEYPLIETKKKCSRIAAQGFQSQMLSGISFDPKPKVRALLYPQKSIECLMTVPVEPGVDYVLMNHDFLSGESGIGAIITEGPLTGKLMLFVGPINLREKAVTDRFGLPPNATVTVGRIVKVQHF